MIEGEGFLDPLRRLLLLPEDRAGVVDEDVDLRIGLRHVAGDPAHVPLQREVGLFEVDLLVAAGIAKLADDALALLGVAGDQRERPARIAQHAGGLQADAVGGACDQAGFRLHGGILLPLAGL